MELMKTNITHLNPTSKAMTQVTMDEDYNVPDNRPDVGRMIQWKGKIEVGEVQVSDARANISGTLIFWLLYVADDEQGKVSSLQGRLPIQETINLEGVQSGEKICLTWELEDLTLYRIHSRKLNIRGLITFQAAVEEEEELALPIELKSEGISQKKEDLQILGLGVHSRDTLRIREEYHLASNKPDIHEILWDTVHVRGLDIRAAAGQIQVKGELFVFVLYCEEEDADALEWLEYSIPFQKEVPCENSDQDMLPDVEVSVLGSTLEVKPDADGEERVIQTDLVLELEMKLYREEKVSVLQDVYSPSHEYATTRQEKVLQRLLIKNYAKSRIVQRIPIDESRGKVFQVCHSEGQVKVDDTRIVEGGILVEGILQIRILYITGDDSMPFYSMESAVPYEQRIETPGICQGCTYTLHTDLEQLSTSMVDGNEIEIKGLINLNVLVLEQLHRSLICQVEETPLDLDKLRMMPGIVGYVVKPGDTLWDIAKTFYTTVDVIKSLNNLQDEEIKPSDTLILVKNVEG